MLYGQMFISTRQLRAIANTPNTYVTTKDEQFTRKIKSLNAKHEGYDYSSVIWQFKGHGYVLEGSSDVCIMQLFEASGHATTLMLRTYNGTLSYYRASVIVPNICNKWFQLNIIYDVEANQLEVYINRVLKFKASSQGGKFHYFKFGVYAQDDDSNYMKSLWKRIKVLKKNGKI
ncbi:hypothetical protein LguiA_013508 [Lonicera macranthoides]